MLEVQPFVDRLDALDTDTESMHAEADDILLEFVKNVAPEVAAAYERVQARVDWWVTA